MRNFISLMVLSLLLFLAMHLQNKKLNGKSTRLLRAGGEQINATDASPEIGIYGTSILMLNNRDLELIARRILTLLKWGSSDLAQMDK